MPAHVDWPHPDIYRVAAAEYGRQTPKRRVVRHHHNRAPLTMQIGEQIQHPLLILFIRLPPVGSSARK